MFKGLVVGAYPASPAHRNWDAGAEEEFFAALVAIPGVGALELPWLGGLHPHDEAWLLANFPAEFHAIMNGIPHTMGRIGASPIYGLASRAVYVDFETGNRTPKASYHWLREVQSARSRA